MMPNIKENEKVNCCHHKYECCCAGLAKFCKFAPDGPEICEFAAINFDEEKVHCSNELAKFYAKKEGDQS